MANVCLPNALKLGEEIESWANSKKAKNTFKEPYSAAFRLVETEFLMSIQDIGARTTDITKGQLGSFKQRLTDLDRLISKGTLDNAFSTSFWQTSKFGKKDPVIGSTLREMQKSNFYFREHESTDKRLMSDMMKSLEKEAAHRGYFKTTGVTVKQAQKKIQGLDDSLQQAMVDYQNGDAKALKNVNKIQQEMQSYVQRTYLKVFDDLIDILENKNRKGSISDIEKQVYAKLSPKDKAKVNNGDMVIKLTSGDLAKLRTPDGAEISKDMYNSVVTYKTLMDGLYQRLRNGVTAQIDGIASRVEMQRGTLSTESLKQLKKNLEGKLMPKYEGNGFFPHYTRDLHVDFMSGLMPKLDALNTVTNPYAKGKNSMTAGEVVADINSYISGHAKRRGEDYEYSKNFLNTVTNYVHDINRFNYTANMTKHMIKGLSDVERIYKTDGDAKGYAQSVVNYITDMNKASNGAENVSPQTRAVMRTLLGFEFISKLGVNPRGAVRNFTQRLLDYVEWGPRQIKKSNDILNRIGLKDGEIEAELKKVGLYFAETSPQLIESELGSPAATFKSVEYDTNTGKHKYVKKSKVEKIADKVGWFAGKASVLHRTAENSNRKHTFKIAFAQMYDWLNTPNYIKQLQKSNPDISDAKLKQIIKSRARNYAVNMVVLNHFDYADYAKSRALRSKAGKFLGQFQHYSFEFLERNIKIMREAKHDILAGKVLPGMDAQGVSKAYRMAMAYFLAPVMASALTGVNFSNLVEHDSANRLKQIATVFTGDEDEINEAFYGKGPIISTFGGPITSDLIDIGIMLDLVDMDDDSVFKLIGGLEKYDENDAGKKIRLLNSFAGRVVGRHIPQLKEGRIGWAIQQELGLYPTAEAKKRQRELDYARKQILPEDLEIALRNLEQGKLG